ncbi:MAG TPA: hypothetical protein VFP87_07290 [Chitinophagaceae bacterium]|nr:hypothetical protein [Chitinophagaceae bacterium]
MNTTQLSHTTFWPEFSTLVVVSGISVMKKFLAIMISPFLVVPLFSQKVDSIYFHLYTDSLKKGQHNYINVDGKLANGHWQPLTSKEVDFSSSAGRFEGNDLVLPQDFKEEKVTVKAELKNNPEVSKKIVIWIKKIPDPDHLPTKEEILNDAPRKSKKKSKG